MKTLIYWALSGIGGIQRFNALLTRALLDLGIETSALIPSSLNLRDIEDYHGVEIKDARIIKYGTTNCKGAYCNLINNIQGNIALAGIAGSYDLVFIDTLFLYPASNILIKKLNYIYYIHGAIMTNKPRPVLTFKPHRLLLHALLSALSNYRILSARDRVYANSLFTAMLSKDALGYMPKILYPPVDINRVIKYAGDKEPIVSMLARFGSAKGWDFAITIFSEALRKCGINDARLYLMGSVGDMVEARYVKHLLELSRRLGIANRVKVLINPGGINDVYKVLSRSMVFIHVRPNEPFGIVVVEAMAAGAVPIVHKSGGPWFDIISMGKYGYGYSNKEEAVEALCKVLTSDREFNRLSNLVRERAGGGFLIREV
ncbi:glycosyltransferase [Vulcanisaeta distributa]|uniref:glycosyltransferase n=1 Tax=Vulcanisaeta distributa TaxID=164451 RepID=UPI0006D0463A|nr:glycosyltransferase [Vulcanisaeta distributa]